VKIRMLKSVPASKDGIHLETFEVGEVITLESESGRAEDLGCMLVKNKLAVEVTPEDEAKAAKKLADAQAKAEAARVKASEDEAKKAAEAEKKLEAEKKAAEAREARELAKAAEKQAEAKLPPAVK
jgi:colicin import membrane protein